MKSVYKVVYVVVSIIIGMVAHILLDYYTDAIPVPKNDPQRVAQTQEPAKSASEGEKVYEIQNLLIVRNESTWIVEVNSIEVAGGTKAVMSPLPIVVNAGQHKEILLGSYIAVWTISVSAVKGDRRKTQTSLGEFPSKSLYNLFGKEYIETRKNVVFTVTDSSIEGK